MIKQIKHNMKDDILRIANDEFERIYGIRIEGITNGKISLTEHQLINYSIAVSLSSIIHYHMFLSEKLKPHGIDIGELNDDSL